MQPHSVLLLTNDSLSGLGEVICHTFAREGCNVAINYFNRIAPAEKVKEEVVSKYGVKAVVIKAARGVSSSDRYAQR